MVKTDSEHIFTDEPPEVQQPDWFQMFHTVWLIAAHPARRVCFDRLQASDMIEDGHHDYLS